MNGVETGTYDIKAYDIKLFLEDVDHGNVTDYGLYNTPRSLSLI